MPKRHLTVCESEVMNVVWDRGEVTVQDVVNGISRPLAYTTVMTTLKILEEKNFVRRGEKRGRAYVYRAAVSRDSTRRRMVRDLADRCFGGSVKTMMLCLVQSDRVTGDDLAELRAAIDSLEGSL